MVNVPAQQAVPMVQALPTNSDACWTSGLHGVTVQAVPVVQAVPMVPAVPMSMAQPMPTQPEAPTPEIIPRTMEIGSIPRGMDQQLWSARELEGTWCACCCPCFCSVAKQTAKDDDVLVDDGCLFLFYLIPCPVTGHKMYRVGNTNSFAEKGKTHEEPQTNSSQSSSSFGGGCSCKLC
mmetsp:Transcript_22086/g.70163  ORF Transcript_22086/g.70163 Transcript_22086/m.70163 type:complete len:178 (+) Transcript_22086:1-534(+)